MAFLFRLLIAVGMIVVMSLAVYLAVVAINRLIQFVAESLGYEVGDFLSWLKSKLPEIRKKK